MTPSEFPVPGGLALEILRQELKSFIQKSEVCNELLKANFDSKILNHVNYIKNTCNLFQIKQNFHLENEKKEIMNQGETNTSFWRIMNFS